MLRGAGLGRWTAICPESRRQDDAVLLKRSTKRRRAAGRRTGSRGWASICAFFWGDRPLKTWSYYRRSLDVDSRNVYAHAMWASRSCGGVRMDMRLLRHASTSLPRSRRARADTCANSRSQPAQTYEQMWAGDRAREARRSGWRTRCASREASDRLKRRLWSIYHFDVVTRTAGAASRALLRRASRDVPLAVSRE